MGAGQTRTMVAIPTTRPRATGGTALALPPTAAWEGRLYAGLSLPAVPRETRASLAATLGEIGVEAEHFLFLVSDFPGQLPPSPMLADAFLQRLDASARRLCRVAGALEVATQSYLTALEARYPDLRSSPDVEDVWWTEFAGGALITGPGFELRLRACGYAYRHIVATHLASNIEAIAEQLALTLHALSMLPPAGVLATGVLYGGLYDLSSMFQGYLIPNHITDLNQETPGLLTGITQLRLLAAREDTSIESDLAWARQQYTRASQLQLSLSPDSAQHSEQWARSAARDWLECIQALEALR
ncbi:MAG TPA: hypothetical protein VJN88_09610 [Ktedonobacterales bacterium]|nr:hypothetical protein [Ktedonobacterales bacterium]